MEKIKELNKREKQILSILDKELGLKLSPKDRFNEKGVLIISAAIKEKKWDERELHDKGIAVSSFNKICSKLRVDAGKIFFPEEKLNLFPSIPYSIPYYLDFDYEMILSQI